MVSADRQQVIETNKSLRLIKNELESLLDKGVIDEEAYDSIHSLLPAEGSLGRRAAAPASSASSTPAPAAAARAPPSNELANLNLGDSGATPPTYAQSNPGAGARPPPPPPPTKPVLCHARALYAYPGSDARDCAFERDDRIAVHEYMNPDWWMGRNLRTGREGIFPRNYVEPEPANTGYAGEKAGYNNGYAGGAGGAPQGYYGGGYPAQQHQQQNPYNSAVPPMAVANAQPEPQHQPPAAAAEGGGGGSKMGEMGKKIGGKLGNAAIFGAGATLGGNLVNSIF